MDGGGGNYGGGFGGNGGGNFGGGGGYSGGQGGGGYGGGGNYGGGNQGGGFGQGGGGGGMGGGFNQGGGGQGGPYMGPTANMTPQQVEQELMRVDNNIRPNHIILMTVLNALYPINVQIIQKVTSPMGKVLRIVVFKRGAIVQSMVEFEDIQAATAAKGQLHGCDIYSGSCTLKVEFAKTDRLNVKRNDEMRKEQECADLVLVIGTSLSGLNADKVKKN